MKKITLIHCYSDQNRGDAGIIESTIDVIKAVNPDVKIEAVSVFHENDDRFINEHYFTRKVVSNVYTALFYEPSIEKNNKGYSTIRKVFVFFKLLFINLLLVCFPYKGFAKIILSKQQYQTFESIYNADVVISKGGSFLYSLKGINGDFFLLRMIFAFVLPVRLKKKVGIFSQSVGPFENKFSKHVLFYILRKLDALYLREEKCLKFIPDDIKAKVVIVPDSAFYLMPDDELRFDLSEKKKIAITARPHKFSNDINVQTTMFEKYLSCLAEMAIHAITLGYEIHLIGQVTGPSAAEDDRVALAKLNEKLRNHQSNVVFWEENKRLMTPKELQFLYSHMSLVIGTRLHSSIFSLAAGVPTINIAYHGTKSQGVMQSVGLQEFVMEITKMEVSIAIPLMDKLLNGEYAKNLPKAIIKHKNVLYSAMSKLIQ